jgi:hypothetical protein
MKYLCHVIRIPDEAYATGLAHLTYHVVIVVRENGFTCIVTIVSAYVTTS